MLKIIRNTIRSYLIACGIALNGIAINFLITKAPPANELVMPTTKAVSYTHLTLPTICSV